MRLGRPARPYTNECAATRVASAFVQLVRAGATAFGADLIGLSSAIPEVQEWALPWRPPSGHNLRRRPPAQQLEIGDSPASGHRLGHVGHSHSSLSGFLFIHCHGRLTARIDPALSVGLVRSPSPLCQLVCRVVPFTGRILRLKTQQILRSVSKAIRRF